MSTLLRSLAALVLLGTGVQAQQVCRQALALGLDVSGSVDAREYRLQLDGLAAALEAPGVADAIFALPDAPVAIAVYEWGTPGQERLLVDWTLLRTPPHLRDIAMRLRATAGRADDPETGIGAAILYGAALLGQQGHCWRRTLDISGDGISNSGPEPGMIESGAIRGITVNGLVIGPTDSPNTNPFPSDLRKLGFYYRRHVMRGPGAFVETAQDFDDFEAAMTRKLIRELQGATIAQAGGPARTEPPTPARTQVFQ